MLITIKAGDTVGRTPEIAAWCRGQGVEPNETYEITIMTTSMLMEVRQYERDEQGRLVRDGQDVKCKPPFRVKLTSLPSWVPTEDVAGEQPRCTESGHDEGSRQAGGREK